MQSTKPPSNLFILKSSLTGVFTLSQIATSAQKSDQLVQVWRFAQSIRDFESMEKAARLMNDRLGPYFFAISDGDWKQPKGIEVERLPDAYKARAILSLGLMSRHSNEILEASKRIVEAHRLAIKTGDLLTAYQAQKEQAILQSIQGNNKGALGLLRNAQQLARQVGKVFPPYWFDYLNSYAVELGENGQVAEAEQISRIAVASPFARIYSEWEETLNEQKTRLNKPSRSQVAVEWQPEPCKANVIHLAERLRPVPARHTDQANERRRRRQLRREIVNCLYEDEDDLDSGTLERALKTLKSGLTSDSDSTNITPLLR
jgi:hypothetical protein